MILAPKLHWRRMVPLLVSLACLLVLAILPAMVDAAEPMATAEPVPSCPHVATAATIEIYYCEDIGLFVNQLGFMAFEP